VFTLLQRQQSGVEQGKQCAVCLNDCTTSSDNVDKQHHQRQHQQDVNEPTDRVATDNAEQPQHQQDYKNRPKHIVFLLLSTTPKASQKFVGTKAIVWGLSNEHAVFRSRFFWGQIGVVRMEMWQSR